MERLDPNIRRIQLGWEVSATPSDEGVRVFGGIWFDSDDLQKVREKPGLGGKAQVFVDPDNLNIATVIVPGHPDHIEVQLQMTAFADMTLGEVLQLMAEYRREDPETADIYHDRLMEVKTRRFADISSISVEHDLPRSYTTIEECKAMAKAVFAGARVIRTEALPGTTAPSAITSLTPAAGVFQLGGGASLIDGVAKEVPVETATGVADPMGSSIVSGDHSPLTPPVETAHSLAPKEKSPSRSSKLIRPQNLKELK